MFVSLQGCLNQISGCWEEERVALLQLKHFFNDPNSLQDWVEGGQHNNADCCQWERVECSSSARRVIRLGLQNTRDWELREWFRQEYLHNFTNLEELRLDGSYLHINLLQSIVVLTSPRELWMWICEVNGVLGSQGSDWLSISSNLEYPILEKNMFNNSILSSLGDLSSLKHLYLNDNRLKGIVDVQDSLNNLEVMDMSNNEIDKFIFRKDLTNLKNLKFLSMDYTSLDLGFLQMIGLMTTLETLSLLNCGLQSILPLEDISNNSFQGHIPKEVADLPSLETLNLSRNHFDGCIPSSIGDMNLQSLDFSYNNLSGEIPEHLVEGCTSLSVLVLSNNKLGGKIFSAKSNLTNLMTLQLNGNSFTGSIPDSLSKASYLAGLYLIDNKLSGRIPSWLENMSSLEDIIMANNHFEGDVPTKLCQLNQLRLVDLSHNNLSGYIPIRLDFTALHSSDHEVASPFCSETLLNCSPIINRGYPSEYPMNRIEESVEFTTKTLSYSYHGKVLTYMSGVDLSCNKLIGPIPPQVRNLTRIHTLNLSHNNLTGPIPLTFSKLKQIESLDLSYNNLNGKVPPQLVDLYTLSSFNVAHNNLSGRTPERVTQFNTFGENNYEGNPLLCGPPLHKSCETSRSTSPMPGASTDKEEDNDLIDMDIIYMSLRGPFLAQLPPLSIEAIAAHHHPKQGLIKSIPRARVFIGKRTTIERRGLVVELWQLQPRCPTTWLPPHLPGQGFGQRVHQGKAYNPREGETGFKFSLRSPSYKSIAHGIYRGMEPRSNISCCNDSIEDDEIYPPSTND
ncbi:hypothetical protein Ddye_028708 [Dipteronia dyeriana]|uniref:Leucine-rich repeat-containing N-terminal plant-type domain-containing protein n=1 Tax=Dipteronia dyeriana TaxID=168575 RepID=A0AAD9WJX6_9ROSI|nr:hypothetical protein Ddye_028708 [Dipteronia dyeriana]